MPGGMDGMLRRLHTTLLMMIVLTLALPWPAYANTAGDNSPPVLTLPGTIAVEATSSSGATVTYTVTASDANPVSPSLTCAPLSGSTFPVGVTVVTCSATGASGVTAHAGFTVRVQDTRPPTISTPTDIALEATGPTGAQVTYTRPTATDVASSDNPTVTCTPASGSAFPIGTTVVNCSAADAAGNSASVTFSVTVVDTLSPSLTPRPTNSFRRTTCPARLRWASGCAPDSARPDSPPLAAGHPRPPAP